MDKDAKKIKPFQILHEIPDKTLNLGFGRYTHWHVEIHFVKDHFLITANNKEGSAEVIKVDIEQGIDQARIIHRIHIKSKLEFSYAV